MGRDDSIDRADAGARAGGDQAGARRDAGPARSTPLNNPFVVSVEGLRGLPGARTAGILAAYAYQQSQDLDGPRGPAADTVERFTAARRLEGWAVWLQLVQAATLIRFWEAHPFDEDDPDPRLLDPGADPNGDFRSGSDEPYVNRLERADPALYERLVGRVNRAQSRTPREVDSRELTGDFVAAELELASGLSRPAADARVLAAQVLLVERSLPRVAELARAGFLDWPKLALLVERLTTLGPVLAPAVERALIPDADLAAAQRGADGAEPCLEVLADPARPGAALPGVTRMSGYRLEAAITAHAVALDPDGAAERAKSARAKRSVWTRTEPDGMARLEASAGQEDVAAVWNALTDAARVARRHGDRRTLDQIRLDELVRRTTGTALPATRSAGAANGTDAHGTERTGTVGAANGTGTAAVANGTNGTNGTNGSDGTSTVGAARAATADVRGDGEADDGGDASPGGVGPGRTPDRRLSVSLLMPLATYLGLTDDPCALDGYGTIPAALARRIAADAVRDHPGTTTWRCVITDNGQPGHPGEHRTVLGLSRPMPTPLSTPKHDPPTRLVELMRIALRRCVFPGCGMPSTRCDLDHRIPYDHDTPGAGGATCSCNLQPSCRRHHRLKTTGMIGVEPITTGAVLPAGSHEAPDRASPGSLELLGAVRWTSRAGLTYTSMPEPVVQSPASEQAEELRPTLYAQRHPDTEALTRLNRKLAETLARNRANRQAEVASWGRETWTETIDRPDHDGLHLEREADTCRLQDPYADLPLPALAEPEVGERELALGY